MSFLIPAIVTFIVVIIALVLILSTLYIVPQQEAYIIERLGAYHRTTTAGLHIKIPFIDRICAKMDLRTQQADLKMDAKTKDNVTIVLGISVQYKIAGPDAIYNAHYLLAEPVEQMQSYVADALRSAIPTHTLDGVFDNKEAIAESVRETIAETMTSFGYDIVATLIVNITLPKDVEEAMNAINAAQRKKDAAQSLAEAEKIRIVTEAEAEKERIITEAVGKAEAAKQAGKGIAEQRKEIAKGISDSLTEITEAGSSLQDANKLFMFTQWVDMMSEITSNSNASTVILPAGFTDNASQFDQIVSGITAAKEVHIDQKTQ